MCSIKKFLLIASFSPLATMAQSGYTISGEIPQLTVPARAYLARVQGGAFKETDSVEIKDGKFQFKGTVNEPQQVLVAVKRKGATSASQRDYLGFFLENSKISLVAKDSIKNATVSGSKSDKENHELEASLRPLTNTIIKLNNEFKGKPKDEAYKKASDSVAQLVIDIKNIRLKFVESHLTSFIGLYTFNTSILDNHFDPATVEPIFHKFSPQLQSSDLGKRSIEKIEVVKQRQIGKAAPDFTQNDTTGKPFTLSSLRGKYVLLDFWASWCVPCRAENPNVAKAYSELKDKNLEIVSVSLDQGKAAWVNAIQHDGMPWIHVSDLKFWKNEVAIKYNISAVPQNFLIDPNGVIIASNLRGEDLTKKLAALIK